MQKKQRRRLVPSRLFTPFPIRMTSFFILSEKVAELVANNRESCGKLPSPTKVAWLIKSCEKRCQHLVSRARTGSSKNIRRFFATTWQAATSARRTYLSSTCTRMGLCVVYMAMARGAYIFWNFQGGDSCTLLRLPQNFRKPTVVMKWRVVHMGNCTYFHPGTSFNSVIWTELKVVPGWVSSRARHVNTCTHALTNRVELSPGWVSSRDEILHVKGSTICNDYVLLASGLGTPEAVLKSMCAFILRVCCSCTNQGGIVPLPGTPVPTTKVLYREPYYGSLVLYMYYNHGNVCRPVPWGRGSGVRTDPPSQQHLK